MKSKSIRIFCALLAVCLVAAVAVMLVPEHAQAVSHSTHGTGWTGRTTLPTSAGKYYLTQDVTISSTWTAPTGSTTICLNGYDITYTGNASAIVVNNASSTLTITDCKSSACGTISGGKGTTVTHTDTSPSYTMQHGGVIFVQSGTLNLENGKISGGDANCGGGICVNTGAKFYMTGGYVSGNNPTRRGANSSLTGEDTSYGGGVYIDSGASCTLKDGYIGGNRADKGGGIYTASKITLYGSVSVSSNTAFSQGGGIYTTADITMQDTAKVTNNVANTLQYNPTYVKKAGGGIYFASGTLKVSGSAVVANNYRYVSNSDTTYLNNAYFASSPTGGIVINGKLNEAADIGVIYETNGKQVTSGWTTKMGDVDQSLYITSDSTVVPLQLYNNELWLHAHSWKYAQHATDTDTINIVCHKCALDANAVYGTIKIEAPDQSHGKIEATVTCSMSDITLSAVEYVGTGSTSYAASTTAPTAAGTYRASISMKSSYNDNAITAYVDYTIHPTHTHAVCGDSACADHSDITWMPTDVLPTEAGNYYLTKDITLTSTWEIHEDIQLCLNGHTITYALTSVSNQAGIYIASNDVKIYPTFTNCSTVGGFTANEKDDSISATDRRYFFRVDSKTIGYSYTSATLDLYNITITNANDFHGCILAVGDNDNNSGLRVNMYDSVISNCGAGRCIVEVNAYRTAGLSMYGTSAIRNCTSAWTVEMYDGQLNMYDYTAIENNNGIGTSVTAGVGGVMLMASDNASNYGTVLSMYDNSAIRNNVGNRVGGIHAYYTRNFNHADNKAEIIRLYDNASVTGNVGGTRNRSVGGIMIHGDTDSFGDTSAYMVVDDNATISGNTLSTGAVSNLYLEDAFCAVIPAETLSTNANIGISMKTPGQFTQNWETVMGTAAVPTDYFFSDNTAYVVTKIDSELHLTEAPKVAEVTTWPTASNLVYGAKLSASTLTGGEASVEGTFSWSNGNEVPTAGTKEYDVTFTPADSAYAPVTGKVSVTVAKADPVVTWPTAYNINYNTLLKDVVLDGGEASVEGSFAWKNPNTLPPAGTASYPMVFTPADTDNYNTVEGQVSVKVNPAATSVTSTPTASGITEGQSLADSVLSGGKASVEGTFEWADPDTVPTVGTHEYDVIFTPANGNYESVTIKVTITVTCNHVFAERIEDAAHFVEGSGADCQSAKEYYYDCTKCDAIGEKTFASNNVGPHSMSTEWTTANEQHYHACTVNGCEYKEDLEDCHGGTASCTAKAVCIDCGEAYGKLAEHVFTEKIEDAAHLVAGSGANCQDAKEFYFDCANCDKIGTETFESGAGDHVPAQKPVSNNDGTHTTYCAVDGCGKPLSTDNCKGNAATCENASICASCGYTIHNKLGHDMGDPVSDGASGHTAQCSRCDYSETDVHDMPSTWTRVDDTTHSRACKDACGYTETASHAGGNATCSQKAVCTDCQSEYGATLPHDWEEDYSHDENGHWHDCEDCNATDGAKPHNPGPEATEESSQVCLDCGRVLTPMLEHKHAPIFVPADPATCTKDGTIAHYACKCDTLFADAQGTTIITDITDPMLDHDMPETWTCDDSQTHSRACARNCGHTETRNHTMPDAWTYVDETTHQRTCTADGCNYTETQSHAGGNATCDDAPICDDCGKAYGEGHGHDMSGQWTYKDDETHELACAYGCGHALTEPHSMSDWEYKDENTHRRTCNVTPISRETNHTCGWEQLEDHYDNDGDSLCDVCGGEVKIETDNPNTGRGNLLIAFAGVLLALGAIGAGAKFIWARKRHFI